MVIATREQRAKSKLELGWFHRYPARFPTSALEEMLESVRDLLDEAPRLLLDPFAGTGSTLAAARQLGIPSYGTELTYLGYLIAKVRLNPPPDLDRAKSVITELCNMEATHNETTSNQELRGWIGEDNASILAQCLNRLDGIKDEKLRDWLSLAVSSALRPSSKWLSGSIKPQTDPNRIPPPLGKNLKRSASALARDCEKEKRHSQSRISAVISLRDACSLPLEDGSVCAVVTSPPYATMYDYYDVQRLSYLAFDWPRENELQIGRSSHIELDGQGFFPPPSLREWYFEDYRAEVTVMGRSLRAYVQRMRDHLHEVERVLRSGGVIAYAVANSRRQERKFLLVDAIAELVAEFSFDNINIKPRNISPKRILPAGRDPKTGRFSSSATPAIDEQIIYAVRH